LSGINKKLFWKKEKGVRTKARRKGGGREGWREKGNYDLKGRDHFNHTRSLEKGGGILKSWNWARQMKRSTTGE